METWFLCFLLNNSYHFSSREFWIYSSLHTTPSFFLKKNAEQYKMSHTLQRKHKSRKRKGLAGSCNTNKTEPTGAEGLLTSQAHPTSRPGSLEHLNCALCCPLCQDVLAAPLQFYHRSSCIFFEPHSNLNRPSRVWSPVICLVPNRVSDPKMVITWMYIILHPYTKHLKYWIIFRKPL